jgi:hypothetical protein
MRPPTAGKDSSFMPDLARMPILFLLVSTLLFPLLSTAHYLRDSRLISNKLRAILSAMVENSADIQEDEL